MDTFEVQCSCGGIWKPRVPLSHNDVVYVCDREGNGARHRPVHWQIRCQNKQCPHGAPVVLRGSDITLLPGFKNFDRRDTSFLQDSDVYWSYYWGREKDCMTPMLLGFCQECRAEKEKLHAHEEHCHRVGLLLKAYLPSRQALRFQDILPPYRQAFKKSLGTRRLRKENAQNAFYSHVLYRDALHKDRIKALEKALETLKQNNPDKEIQAMVYKFFWSPTGDNGLLIHSLSIEFPTMRFTWTV